MFHNVSVKLKCKSVHSRGAEGLKLAGDPKPKLCPHKNFRPCKVLRKQNYSDV